MNKMVVASLSVILVLSAVVSGCSVHKEVSAYADSFVANLNSEIDALNTLVSEYNNADFDTDYGVSSFQRTVPNHLSTFNSFLNSYQFTYPSTAPQELKDAVKLARDGTSRIIFGINTENNALSTLSNSLLTSGENAINEGGKLLDQSAAKYNVYADAYNARVGGGTNFGSGILIGTGTLWLLTLLFVNPITAYLAKREYALQYVDGRIPADAEALSQKLDSINTRTYILVDIAVLGTVGFFMGLLIGWYFIGITWKAKHWPGLIAFIGLSLLGSYLY